MGTKHLKNAVATAVVAIAIAVTLGSATRLEGQDNNSYNNDPRVEQGFTIAPVPLNLAGKDRNLVGLGSYIVNSSGACNSCHTSGAPPLYVYPYASGGNPYFGQPQKIDPTAYLDGGADFGPVGTPTGPLMYGGPDIIARNLTPNYTGMAEGGHTLSQFKQIIRTGIDFDGIHPTCSTAQLAIINSPDVTPAQLPNCIPATPGINPVDGNVLQVMPWPNFSYLTDRDIEAIYEYLSAIPCIDNTTSTPPAGAPNELLNTCGTKAAEVQASSNTIDSGLRRDAVRSRR